MEEQEIKRLLDKFNAGKCTPEELQLLQTLQQQLSEDQEVALSPIELKEKVWRKIEDKLKSKQKIRQLNTSWLKIAAAFLITIGSGALFWHLLTKRDTGDVVTYQTITVPKGKMKAIALPDGTIIHLNSASSIKVPIAFAGKKREVFLTEGEAFFEVKHDIEKPFLVHTGKVITQVLGTSFNIKYYRDLPELKVFVNSGKVEIHDQEHTLGMYTPNQELIYNSVSHEFTKVNIAGNNLLSWMHEELILDDVSFKEMVIYLQNRYNVKVKYRSKDLDHQRYSVRFPNKLDIRQVMDILQVIDGRQYRLKNNIISIE
ncbi:MAG TPA: FecR domain-containing protein [Mucilaginibacter sp.]|nr:FecR domain-containing protein [Mucilaginibacter sp.]